MYYTDVRARAVSIENVVEDSTPQLGGNLDLNSNAITGTGHLEPVAGTTYTPPAGSGSDTSTVTSIALRRGQEISIGHNGFVRNLLQYNTSGHIQIGDDATGLYNDVLIQPGATSGVKLGYNGVSYKLQTTATGVDITGVATAGSFATTNYTDDDGTSTLTTTSATTIDTWPAGADSGEYLIEAIQGSDKQVCKIVCLDTGSDLLISVYGILYTSASPLVTFTGAYYSGSPILQATPASASSMTIKWKRTFIN